MSKKEEKKILVDVTNIKSQESFTLPSKGLIYDETEKIPASITLRRMTTKEDKIRMRNSSQDKIRRDILQACIVDKEVDASKLKLTDANFLLFRLRVLSLLDDVYKVQVNCPNCGTTYIHEVKLSQVPVDYFKEDNLKMLTLELPVSKMLIEFKYPSLGDMIKMGDKLKSFFDKFPNSDKAEAIYTTSAMLYIKKINGETMMSEELENLIDNLDIVDNRYLRKQISLIDEQYGLNEEIACKCPNCKETVVHGLPITDELFNPSF